MGYLFFFAFLIAIAWSLWDGKFIGFGGLIDRQTEPKLFFAAVALSSVMGIASLVLAISGKF